MVAINPFESQILVCLRAGGPLLWRTIATIVRCRKKLSGLARQVRSSCSFWQPSKRMASMDSRCHDAVRHCHGERWLFASRSIIKFMPYPVTVGFTAGVATFASQIKDLFGLSLSGSEPGALVPSARRASGSGWISPQQSNLPAGDSTPYPPSLGGHAAKQKTAY